MMLNNPNKIRQEDQQRHQAAEQEPSIRHQSAPGCHRKAGDQGNPEYQHRVLVFQTDSGQ